MRITKRLKGIMSAQRWVKKFKLPNHTPHSIQQTLSKESHRGYFRLNRAIEEAASCSDRKQNHTATLQLFRHHPTIRFKLHVVTNNHSTQQ